MSPPDKAARVKGQIFERVPKDTKIKYLPYEYAEQAHKDLSVTKVKGFTNEEDKKKRGSYWDRMIDVNARKGIKFED